MALLRATASNSTMSEGRTPPAACDLEGIAALIAAPVVRPSIDRRLKSEFSVVMSSLPVGHFDLAVSSKTKNKEHRLIAHVAKLRGHRVDVQRIAIQAGLNGQVLFVADCERH